MAPSRTMGYLKSPLLPETCDASPYYLGTVCCCFNITTRTIDFLLPKTITNDSPDPLFFFFFFSCKWCSYRCMVHRPLQLNEGIFLFVLCHRPCRLTWLQWCTNSNVIRWQQELLGNRRLVCFIHATHLITVLGGRPWKIQKQLPWLAKSEKSLRHNKNQMIKLSPSRRQKVNWKRQYYKE